MTFYSLRLLLMVFPMWHFTSQLSLASKVYKKHNTETIRYMLFLVTVIPEQHRETYWQVIVWNLMAKWNTSTPSKNFGHESGDLTTTTARRETWTQSFEGETLCLSPIDIQFPCCPSLAHCLPPQFCLKKHSLDFLPCTWSSLVEF